MYSIKNIRYFYIVVCVSVFVMFTAVVVPTFVISTVNFVLLMAATRYWMNKSAPRQALTLCFPKGLCRHIVIGNVALLPRLRAFGAGV